MAKKQLNLMDMIPSRIRDYEKQEDGNIHVLYPRFQWGFLKRWLMPRLEKPYIHITLDSMGTHVWQAIDGAKTVYEIARELQSMDEKEEESWYMRIGMFVQMLKNRDLIDLKLLEDNRLQM